MCLLTEYDVTKESVDRCLEKYIHCVRNKREIVLVWKDRIGCRCSREFCQDALIGTCFYLKHDLLSSPLSSVTTTYTKL